MSVPAGLFEAVSGYMEEEGRNVKVAGMNLSDAVIPHASISQQREMFKISAQDIAAKIISILH